MPTMYYIIYSRYIMYDRKTIILYIVQVVSLTHRQHDDDDDDEIKYLIMTTNNLNDFLFPLI